MKKLLFLFSTLFLFSAMVNGQEDPEKALSKAGRALGSYNLDPANNTDKLTEALGMIEIAAADATVAGKTKTWQTRGEIYTALADKDIQMLALDQTGEYVPENPEAALNAAQSFAKAFELAEKKYEKKDAIKGLQESATKLNAIGNNQIRRTDYAGAFKSLDMVSTINGIVVSAEEAPVIPEADAANHRFVLAFCAHASGEAVKAKQLFKELYESGTQEESVYAQYANILLADGDSEGALAVLDKGSALFPTSSEILFSKINIFIQKQDYKKLEEMLIKAVAAEPDNPSVYSALGNVYMNLFTDEFAKNKDSGEAKQYFEEALQYFKKSLELDPEMFDASYSIGSLHFNKAVELIKYAGTLSIKQQKEYDATVAESTKLMETALPYFKKAESLNANDTNTLIALSEIFARMSDFEKSNEFKKRLQTVQEGGTNPKSYFKS